MQQFQAVEEASANTPWEIAEKLELIPDDGPAALRHKERAVAIRLAKNETNICVLFGAGARG